MGTRRIPTPLAVVALQLAHGLTHLCNGFVLTKIGAFAYADLTWIQIDLSCTVGNNIDETNLWNWLGAETDTREPASLSKLDRSSCDYAEAGRLLLVLLCSGDKWLLSQLSDRWSNLRPTERPYWYQDLVKDLFENSMKYALWLVTPKWQQQILIMIFKSLNTCAELEGHVWFVNDPKTSTLRKNKQT